MQPSAPNMWDQEGALLLGGVRGRSRLGAAVSLSVLVLLGGGGFTELKQLWF